MADSSLDNLEPDDTPRSDGTPEPDSPEPSKKYEFRVWHNDQIVYRFQSDDFIEFSGPAIPYPDGRDRQPDA